jgi:CheY-like chemotaxis protein
LIQDCFRRAFASLQLIEAVIKVLNRKIESERPDGKESCRSPLHSTMNIDDITSSTGHPSSKSSSTDNLATMEDTVHAVWTKTGEGTVSHRGATETVMLVDDEEGVRKIASLALRRNGYAVIEATDGDMAVAMLAAPATPKIDVLLSDIRMGGVIDGHRLASFFSTKYPDAPVLLMSGDRVNDPGRDNRISYVAKPFTIYSLPAEVRKAIDRAAGCQRPSR